MGKMQSNLPDEYPEPKFTSKRDRGYYNEEWYWVEKIKVDKRRNVYAMMTMIFTALTALGAMLLIFL